MVLPLGIQLQLRFLQVANKLPEILAFRWWFLLLLSYLKLRCRQHIALIASGFPSSSSRELEGKGSCRWERSRNGAVSPAVAAAVGKEE